MNLIDCTSLNQIVTNYVSSFPQSRKEGWNNKSPIHLTAMSSKNSIEHNQIYRQHMSIVRIRRTNAIYGKYIREPWPTHEMFLFDILNLFGKIS